MRWSAGCTTNTLESELSVHTGGKKRKTKAAAKKTGKMTKRRKKK
jgi:hypothetical protein